MKNNYKHLLYFFGLIIISAISFISCGNNDTVYESKVVTERHLSTGEKTYVTEKHIVVLSLEHQDSDADEHDLGEIGSDCFILRPTKDLNNISLEIGEDTTIGLLSIEDTIGGEISTFTKDDEGATYSFKAGNSYEYCVTHDNSRKKHQALFIRFESDESQDDRLTFDQQDVDDLNLTGDCTGCDLSGASLEYMQLPDANLSGANLSGASLFGTDLSNADLIGAHLRYLNLEEATLDHTTIDYKYFSFTSIKNASFVGTTIKKFPKPENATNPNYAGINFSHANLSNLTIESITFDSNCTFHYTDFTDASLYGSTFIYGNLAGAIFNRVRTDSDGNMHVDFTKANLSNATWTDGRKCLEGSIGECLDESDSNVGDGNYNFSDPFLISGTTGLSDNTAGGGIEMGDTDGDGKPNLIAFYIDNPVGENRGYYQVSTNIRSDGSVESWTDPFEIPWTEDRNQGGGIAMGDTDGDGIPNLVVFYIDNPVGQNHGYYRVSKNIQPDGSVESWSAPFEIPGWFGVGSAGGGINMYDTDKDGIPNLVLFHVYNHDGVSGGFTRVSTNIQSDGSVESWTDPYKMNSFFGSPDLGAGGTLLGKYPPMLILFYIDNPSGENHGYYHRCDLSRYSGDTYCLNPHEISGSFGDSSAGGGLAGGDYDGSGYSNLFIYHIDNSHGRNNSYYRIGNWDNLISP